MELQLDGFNYNQLDGYIDGLNMIYDLKNRRSHKVTHNLRIIPFDIAR